MLVALASMILGQLNVEKDLKKVLKIKIRISIALLEYRVGLRVRYLLNRVSEPNMTNSEYTEVSLLVHGALNTDNEDTLL